MAEGTKVKLELTEKQFNKVVELLDVYLKLNGLAVVGDAIDLYNAFMAAMAEAKKSNEIKP